MNVGSHSEFYNLVCKAEERNNVLNIIYNL